MGRKQFRRQGTHWAEGNQRVEFRVAPIRQRDRLGSGQHAADVTHGLAPATGPYQRPQQPYPAAVLC
jgi:hypothetical protein